MAEFPPTICFAPNNPGPRGRKDTLANIEATNEFVVNLPNWDLREQMNATSAHVAPDEDEFKLAGLTASACRVVKVPRVGEAPVSLECVFMHRLRSPAPTRRSRTTSCSAG